MVDLDKVTSELVSRLRVAGHTVDTESDDLVIDGVAADLHIDSIQRWGKAGVHVWWGPYCHVPSGECKTDRWGTLDFDAILGQLLPYIEQKRQRLRREQEIEDLRQRVVEVLEDCGVEVYLPRFTIVKAASVRIEDREVVVSVRVPSRNRNKLKTLVKFFQSF